VSSIVTLALSSRDDEQSDNWSIIFIPMSAPVVSLSDYALKSGEYSLILSDLPEHGVHTIGVLLLDLLSDTLHIRLRRDWRSIGNEEDVEVLLELADDLRAQAQERGGAAVLAKLEDEASLSIRVTNRETIMVRNFDITLDKLYRQHVQPEVLPFRTHLPRFSLAVAAGPFLANPEDVSVEEWVEVSPELRLDENMFIARIHGQSMEPTIPDGSLCVFRRGIVGSFNNRLVLVQNLEHSGDNQYTVKRYIEKILLQEGAQQMRVRLESLNPAYPSWDLGIQEGKYEVIAEFVRVLE